MKKLGILSLILTASLLLGACQGKTQEGSVQSAQKNSDAVFKEETGIYALEEGDVSCIKIIDDTLYVEQFVYDYEKPQARTMEETKEDPSGNSGSKEEAVTDGETVLEEEIMVEGADASMLRKITGFGMDGEVKSRYSKEMNLNSGGGVYTADAQGNLYSVVYQYASYEGDDNTDKIYLECSAPDGTRQWEIWLNENLPEGEYFYTGNIFSNENNQIILDTNRGIEIYDHQANLVKMIEKPQSDDSMLISIRDGKFAFISSDGEGAGIQNLDLESGVFGEKIKFPFNYYRYQIMNGKIYDLYLADDYGVYGYNIGDAEITKIMDFISSDFSASYLYHVSFWDENTFAGYYYDDEGGVLSRFTKVAPEDVTEKTELTLGCYYIDYNVKQKVVAFNKKNTQYRINIKDYAMYDTAEDYGQGLARLNTDIVSGEIPDLMILSSQMPVNSYIAKGVFEDLNPFLEKDVEVKKEDLLANVLNALSSEDGLYRISPSFSVITFLAKTADVGKEPGWTMEEAVGVIASKPEGTRLLSEVTSGDFIHYLMWICGEQYVDWNKKECYFNSDGFIKALEYAATLPREIDYSAVMDDESYWQEMETQYRNGKTVATLQYISGFRDYNYAKQGIFGEDITMIGFPSENGLGAGLNINNSFAISALGEHQQAAWEFVRTFFTQESQDSLTYDFPVRISSLRKLEEQAWEKPFTLDENGNRQEYEDLIQVGGMDVELVPLTKEETGVFMNYLQSLDKLCVNNEAISNIVSEEIESYFAGQKSAKEVAEVIQSRVKIYVNENS